MRRKHLEFVKQHDAMQCGVACLTMICRYYGMNYSTEYIDNFCHANVDGVSMLGISEAAKAIGLETTTFAATTAELSEIKLPCILHWNQNHFVILYKISKDAKKYIIADPGKGIVKYSVDELDQHWLSTTEDNVPCGIVMQLFPTESFYRRQRMENDKKCSFKFLYGIFFAI